MSLVASTNDKLEILPIDPNQQPTFNEKKILDTIYPLSEFNQLLEKKELNERFEKEKELKEKLEKEMQEKEEKEENETKEKEKLEKEMKEMKEMKEKRNKRHSTLLKHVIIATFIYILFQFPYIDTLITKIIPSDKFYYKFALKTFLFMTVYFIIAQLFLTSE
jgi:cation transport ATPase